MQTEPTTTEPTNPTTQQPNPSPCLPVSPSPCLESPLLPPLYPGCLNLLIGHPGTGKSLLALHLAQRLTHNAPPLPAPFQPTTLPQTKDTPHFAYLTRENPGLLYYLHCLRIPFSAYQEFPDDAESFQPSDFSLGTGHHLRNPPKHGHWRFISPAVRHLQQTEIKLLILDPLPHFIGPIGAPATSIARQLHGLLDWAAAHNAIVLGISHLNKRRNKKTLLQTLGSTGYAAHARNILLLTDQPPPLSASVPNSLSASVPQCLSTAPHK